ncbi:2-octaprenyl-6-methoxyphenyl hydroxylase [Legionella micdadei]|uniref:2-octaprenyl-6-methoxyphenyl hydroxylase n=1 Tax=Legionella micdadei TaxID=451 RepID=UPI003A802167
MVERQVDILIVGGGLTGAILMLALANKGYNIVLIDTHPLSAKVDAHFDARTLALSPASIRILQMLDIWPLLQNKGTPIETIHVSEQRRFGSTTLANEANKPLGYVVEMQHINHALYQLLDEQHVLAPAKLIALDKDQGLVTVGTENENYSIKAKLIVAADGTDSSVRQLSALPVKIKDYQQQAIVANVGLARAHGNRAYERFTASGPLALLPMAENRVSLVWALPPAEAARLSALDEAAFIQALQKAFGYRLGRFVRVGKRVIFPLRQVTMAKKVDWPLVFVGNAAHTLHPVAGQGFNLGLRDVATLAQCITQQGLNAAMLQNYQYMRQHDEMAITRFTDGLIDVFTSQLPGMALARNLGLIAVDNLKILKQCLTHYTSGFAGVTPDLVCGIALEKKGA